MQAILHLIGRNHALFADDVAAGEDRLRELVGSSRFLLLGGAGSIGQAVAKEIFKRGPRKLHVVDLSENNLVELVRDLRSSLGYIAGDFRTFALDIGSAEYDAFMQHDGAYDYVLNLSALKHVRSEKDPFTLMRMIGVNILNTEKTLLQSIAGGVTKYFCVSTDKAANPVNLMGASKRIMEMFLMRRSLELEVSTARFANVAFSDGSLLHGFDQRMQKRQPLVAPLDVRRYFLTPQESGELCLMSCMLGENRDIFFPKISESLRLISFSDIAIRYLHRLGLQPYRCQDEAEARELIGTLPDQGKWPCYFGVSDTTGEKGYEEFYTERETLDLHRFRAIGIIKNRADFDSEKLEAFLAAIGRLKSTLRWSKADIVDLFREMLPDFAHQETGKHLDAKM
jgi:FlaA1/EpsC-like NDP-sugar epimerase